jgi:hypothetical protein
MAWMKRSRQSHILFAHTHTRKAKQQSIEETLMATGRTFWPQNIRKLRIPRQLSDMTLRSFASKTPNLFRTHLTFQDSYVGSLKCEELLVACLYRSLLLHKKGLSLSLTHIPIGDGHSSSASF